MRRVVTVAVVLWLMAGSSLRAQSTQPAAAADGLDALPEERVISELAERGLADLAERAMEANQVPANRREALRAMMALRQLGDPAVKLSAAQRQEAIGRVVSGIEQALPTMDDPAALVQQANTLLRVGVERDVKALEYWGEQPRTQERLKPVVQTIIKMLDKAAAEAQRQADELGNKLSGPNDPRGKQWEEINAIANSANYTRHMADYYLALATDAQTSGDERREIPARAIDYLRQFDNADSNVQANVRNRVGKLHMIRGEYDLAKGMFASVATGKDVAPPPTPAQQYEARYFGALCDVLAEKPAEALGAVAALGEWQKTLPEDASGREGIEAAYEMLQYRLAAMEQRVATDPAAQQAAGEQARAVLLALVKRRPDLKAMVFEQLLAKLPHDADVTKLDALLLEGLVQRAFDQTGAKTPDAQALGEGLAAAREIIRRRNDIDAEAVNSSALLVGLFLDKLGEPVEAANAFLDYLRDFKPDLHDATAALDQAQSIIGRLRTTAAGAADPAVAKVYARFLPTAIGEPFNRRELAYEYGRLLQSQGKNAAAIEQFELVPGNDSRAATAKFYELVAIRQRLEEEKLSAEERKQLTDKFEMLAEVVRQRTTALESAARTDPDRQHWRALHARALVLWADDARRERNDPQRTLELLKDVEALAKGLPSERDLLAAALYTRVQAYMTLGQSDQATAALVKLLSSRGGGEGAGIVYTLMQKLNAEFDRARAEGDRAAMLRLARNRAELSGFLVEWASTNPDEGIRKFTYRYAVFDANTKKMAADLEQDQRARAAGLDEAMQLYKKLESPEGVRMYHQTLDPKSPEAQGNEADPAVSLGIGLTAYEQGDYVEAQRRLEQLLSQRKLGAPTTTVEENGEQRMVDNDLYWEATLKLLRSNLALASHPSSSGATTTMSSARLQTQNYLKELYIRWGKEVGGKKWHEEFERLRAEIIPDFVVDSR